MSYHDGYVAQHDINPPKPRIKKKTLCLSVDDNFVKGNHRQIDMLDIQGNLKNPNDILKEVALYLERLEK